MAKGLCFWFGRGGHQIRDCLDTVKKEEKKKEEPKKLLKEERFAKIRALSKRVFEVEEEDDVSTTLNYFALCIS
uniref:CCHC-type domain-containing protein n=1 Tax=Moniliophthora roreri TaxID=221103 RepID=A0A0W0FL69_MONRR